MKKFNKRKNKMSDKEIAAAKAKLEAEQKAKEEAVAKAKLEAELKEAAAKAKLEAEQKAKEIAAAKAKLEAELKSKLEAEQKAKEEAEAKAKHLSAYEIEFKIIGPTGKVVDTKIVTGKGESEDAAFADARAQIDKTLKEDQSVNFTGKFKKL